MPAVRSAFDSFKGASEILRLSQEPRWFFPNGAEGLFFGPLILRGDRSEFYASTQRHTLWLPTTDLMFQAQCGRSSSARGGPQENSSRITRSEILPWFLGYFLGWLQTDSFENPLSLRCDSHFLSLEGMGVFEPGHVGPDTAWDCFRVLPLGSRFLPSQVITVPAGTPVELHQVLSAVVD